MYKAEYSIRYALKHYLIYCKWASKFEHNQQDGFHDIVMLVTKHGVWTDNRSY